VAEKNDAGSSFFFRGKNAVAIGIEKAEDSVVGLLPAAVLKNPDVSIFGNGSLHLLRELNRTLGRVVMADEAADEADHNVRGSDRWLGPDCIDRAGELRRSCGQNRENDERSAK
jgi:hypothetical protein